MTVAGHPPPFLLADATALPVDRKGPMLGAFEDASWETDVVELDDGEGLVLYTDGLIEARRGDDRFGLGRLARNGGGLPRPGTVAVDRLDAAMQEFTGGRDRGRCGLGRPCGPKFAACPARGSRQCVSKQAGETMRPPSSGLALDIPAEASNVAVVRHALTGLAQSIGMDDEGVADVQTVVTEACMNAVVHAYPDGRRADRGLRRRPSPTRC